MIASTNSDRNQKKGGIITRQISVTEDSMKKLKSIAKTRKIVPRIELALIICSHQYGKKCIHG